MTESWPREALWAFEPIFHAAMARACPASEASALGTQVVFQQPVRITGMDHDFFDREERNRFTSNLLTTRRRTNMHKIILIMASAFLLTACSITQNIEPAQISRDSELCIIENPKVRAGFLEQYQSALSSKGIPHRLVSGRSIPESCDWTSTYIARWKWDLALYMSYAKIKVFHDGSLDGEATYDSTKGGANMGKFIDAEPKIRELVDELLQVKSSASKRARSPTQHSAELSGDSLFQAENIAEKQDCAIDEKLKDEAQTEVYSAECGGGDNLLIRCEWGNCESF